MKTNVIQFVICKLYYDKYENIAPDTLNETIKYDTISDEDFLSVSDMDLVNKKQDKILLQGVNVGGWLLQEYWMCPVYGDPEINQWTYLETLQVLENRFGFDNAQELISIYEDNWITEQDFKNISDLGFNVIRLPFWYRNFLSDAEGTWISEDIDDNPGIKRLDWALEMGKKYGVYVILDMHGCPGGQSTDHCSGSARKCELYTNTKYLDTMEELWVTIADRYKDNPVVAAYDIMNEPMYNYESDNVMDDMRNQIYDRMIHAIRATGDNHIITVEGIWSINALPKPSEINWDNVMYQVHAYNNDVDTYCEQIYEYSEQYNVPVYIGEFFDQNFFSKAKELSVNCTSWTYKGTNSEDGNWFIYCSDQIKYVDVYNDPEWLIKMKWGKCLQTNNFEQVLMY